MGHCRAGHQTGVLLGEKVSDITGNCFKRGIFHALISSLARSVLKVFWYLSIKSGDASYWVGCFNSQWSTAFWVLGSSMCPFFLGEHIISFIFIMSLQQQIFILDILRLRTVIFSKTLLSEHVSGFQFVGVFSSLSTFPFLYLKFLSLWIKGI